MLCLTHRKHGSVANLTCHFSSIYSNCSVWRAPDHSSLCHSKWQHIKKAASSACCVLLLADLYKRIVNSVYQFTMILLTHSALIPVEVQQIAKEHKNLKLSSLFSFLLSSSILKKRTPGMTYFLMNISQQLSNPPKYNG